MARVVARMIALGIENEVDGLGRLRTKERVIEIETGSQDKSDSQFSTFHALLA